MSLRNLKCSRCGVNICKTCRFKNSTYCAECKANICHDCLTGKTVEEKLE